VLGAQKTGTSSFAKDLKCAGVELMQAKDNSNWKEMHFFDARHNWRGVDVEREKWLRRFPACSSARGNETSSAKLLADFTPDNLRMVRGEKPYNDVFVNMPETLHRFYGADASKKLTFVILIREPLSRMHSAWYAAKMCDHFGAICTDDCRADSIQAAMRTALVNAHRDRPVHTEWLWTSMYARHMKEWLSKFDAKQFYVIPYREYAHGNADGICGDLAERLNFQMDCQSNGVPVSHEWKSNHPELDADFPLKSELRQAFDSFMQGENVALWELLAMAHKNGMGLANYNGTKGSAEEIRSWVQERW
jgi:hypothetical protein